LLGSLILLCIIIANFHSFAGFLRKELKGDITQKSFYKSSLNKINNIVPPEDSVIFLGDSIFYGFGANEINGLPVVNYSIPGDTSSLMVNRLPGLNFAKQNRVTILIGVNDLRTNVAPTEVIDNIFKIAEYLKPLVYDITIAKVILTNGISRNNAHIRKLNNLIEQSFGENYPLIDFNSALKNKIGSAWQYTNDGIHLTEEGYRVLKQQLDSHYR